MLTLTLRYAHGDHTGMRTVSSGYAHSEQVTLIDLLTQPLSNSYAHLSVRDRFGRDLNG
jgi:hypothetical protein